MMKRTAVKAVFAIVLVVTLLMTFSVSAFAYRLAPYRHQNTRIYYYYDNWVDLRAISLSNFVFFYRSQCLESKDY